MCELINIKQIKLKKTFNGSIYNHVVVEALMNLQQPWDEFSWGLLLLYKYIKKMSFGLKRQHHLIYC